MENGDDSSGNGQVQHPYPSTRILWQLSVFLVGFISLLALHWFFTNLIDELGEETAKERARLFVGEQIVGEIRDIESDVYRMATTLGVKGQQRIKLDIGEKIDGIRHNLDVLRNGGTARKVIRLNLQGHDLMIKEVRYHPTPEDRHGYILEIIDLAPKLEEIEGKIGELSDLLARRESVRATNDKTDLFVLERRIKFFLKKLPPLFTRLTENANRMFYESQQRLTGIERRIAERTRYYRINELVMVAVIIVSVMLLGLMFARQINRSNTHLAEARDRMREAKEDAERANRAKSEFLSRMSHELRTPLNAILGFSQLLEIDDKLSTDQRDGIREIGKAGRHLLDLINEILDLSKIEAGRMVLEDIEFEIPLVVEEVVSIMATKAHDKGLELHVFTSPELPASLFGDPTRLKQILINLLGNAVKFTESGDVGLRIEPERERDSILFEVVDSGIGFDAATRKRLFRPFTQADESTTRQFGGTGLGLVICKELVEAMGGEIDAEAVPGQGARFWFRLPAGGAMETAPPHSELFNGMPVLVVDDHAAVRYALERYLAAFGAVASSASDAAAALSQARRAQIAGAPIQLVLLDAELPDGDAEQLIRGLRSDPELTQPKVALMFKGGGTTDGTGADLSLNKPVTVNALAGAMADARLFPRPAESATEAKTEPQQAADGPIRVLLVEDQAANRKLAASMLTRLGVTVDSVADGTEALDAYDAMAYDLIFMDMQMPEMDGIEATQHIRQRERERRLHHVPIVAMTANAMQQDRDDCLEAGMDDHLPKPISFDAIEEQLKRWVPVR